MHTWDKIEDVAEKAGHDMGGAQGLFLYMWE